MKSIITLLIVFGLQLDMQFAVAHDSSLIEAVKKGNLNDLKKSLESSKTNIDHYLYDDNTTPLMLAVRNNNKDMVEVLLEAGANPYITPCGIHNTALRESVTFGFDEITNLLLQRCYNCNYTRPANFPNSNEPYYNRQSAWDLENDSTNYERSLGFALIEVAKKGRKDLIKILYEKGAHLNIISRTISVSSQGDVYLSSGSTSALIEAVKNNDIHTAELLLNMGADINLGPTDKLNYYLITTPLAEAVRAGSIDMVQMLLARGADRHVSLCYGGRLLDIAEDEESLDIYYLIRDGVDKR